MTNMQPQGAISSQDDFGRRVAARLTGGTSELPHTITERLRASRVQAVQRRKRAPLQTSPVALPLALAGGLRLGLWTRLASAVPVIALTAGLVAIQLVQNELRAVELAEVDAALLTDDLPPAAYTDPGFLEYLKVTP